MIRRVAIALLLLVAGCSLRRAVIERLTIDFTGDDDRVRVTSVVELDSGGVDRPMARRLQEWRDAIAGGRDPWSLRFARLSIDAERTIVDRKRGAIERAERSALVAREELQKLFAEDALAIAVLPVREGMELTIYPGSPSRATRQQRERIDRKIGAWAADVARYFAAVDRFYQYLGVRPDRAEALFDALLSGDTVPEKDEQPMMDEIGEAMQRLVERIDAEQGEAYSVDEEVDLVFNPFPAEITIRLPREPLAAEGFRKSGDRSVTIPTTGLTEMLREMEGTWIAPDPLLLLLRADEKREDPPPAKEIAALTRRSTRSVSAAEIEAAVRARLRPAPVYRVRW